jgi:hypothetical protein
VCQWGGKQSPDFAQEVMEDIFQHLTDIEVYIDDIGIWAQSWEHHQRVVAEVLKLLEENGFNKKKSLRGKAQGTSDVAKGTISF